MNESFIKTHARVDLIGAILSGMCVGFILAWTRSSGDELNIHAFIKIVLLTVCSYCLLALLLPQWKDRPLLKIPNWILIAVGGSILTFLSVNTIIDVQPMRGFIGSDVVGHVSGQIEEQLMNLVLSTIVDSLIALPILGTLHYTAQGVTAMRRRTRLKKGTL